MAFRTLEAALNATWAMEESALETLLDIAAREHEVTPEAIEAYRAQAADGAERAYIRDGVGVITAKGPMFRYANLMTAFSGATSYDVLRKDLQALVDGGAKAILLNVNSPGGEVNGANEFAQAVHDLRTQMPVVAYVGGQAASAGYWVASGASKIYVDPTAMLGSLGAQLAFVNRDPKPGEKRYHFVSSVSPLKNADPDTEAGATAMQGVVDALGKVFIQMVARNRGVSVQTVLSDFGKGGILVGQDAVSAGLADGIGSFESVLADLVGGRSPQVKAKGTSMQKTKLDPAMQALVDEACAKVAAQSNLAAIGQTLPATAKPVAAHQTAAIEAAQLALSQAAAIEAGKLAEDRKIAGTLNRTVEAVTAARKAAEARDTPAPNAAATAAAIAAFIPGSKPPERKAEAPTPTSADDLAVSIASFIPPNRQR